MLGLDWIVNDLALRHTAQETVFNLTFFASVMFCIRNFVMKGRKAGAIIVEVLTKWS